ncbi:DEAD-domain-containing protein [Tothia fuscella]|uniref:RNA helicase n=1 Tax=Tothia fuscella TaxID=1048955 RepID=A0A9P4NI04_9PEZI|nr:DEAD-domain-containing protein [Tothia fuscella]
MPTRAVSPAQSENEFDIFSALVGDDDAENAEFGARKKFKKSSLAPTPQNVPDLDIFQDGAGNVSSGDDDGDAAFISGQQTIANRKSSNLMGKTVKKGGGFQAMGLNSTLLKAITRKGFSVPTPIQRKAIPLMLDKQDVVGMARTGSGKTAAFVIPMIQRLKGHSARVGARALIISPSRELALQTMKVVKELGRGTDLRTVLIVGGESLEDQFKTMTSNPDIIIATPGRLLHLKVEMKFDLSSIQYVVFDEADRLYEMGFAAQLAEILHGLPTNRQTLLFSATLPKTLVEFARAGLQEPVLVRLDGETKISPDLESAFFTLKSADKEGALLHLLQDVIGIPTGETEAAKEREKERKSSNSKKRKQPSANANTEAPTAYSTIIFAATKHHVEYLSALLRASGYAVSYVYGSLDQTARKINVQAFRDGLTNILVVTDVAARGIDLPILSNVINYDFPTQPKIFVHRVGRTARAGRKGWSYNLVRDSDMPYLLDLQLFLSRRLVLGRKTTDNISFSQDVIVGTLAREKVMSGSEWVNKLLEDDADLYSLRQVATKGEKLYNRSRNSASAESAKRSREVLANPGCAELSPLFGDDKIDTKFHDRENMLARLRGFRPQETVFEIGKRGTVSDTVSSIQKARAKIIPHRTKASTSDMQSGNIVTPAAGTIHISEEGAEGSEEEIFDDDVEITESANMDMESASENELEVTFGQPGDEHNSKNKPLHTFQDSEHFMTYTPRHSNIAEDRAYGVHSGANTNSHSADFLVEARGATMDLNNDENSGFKEATKAKGMRWDKKGRKYVARQNDEDGSKGTKYVIGESGQKIAASFRSGRFDAWRKSNRMERMPRVGEAEAPSSKFAGSNGKQYRHKKEAAPKEADRYRDDYDVRKKRVAEAREKRVGRFRDGGGKSELRSVSDVHKERKQKEKKRDKNARPARKGRK